MNSTDIWCLILDFSNETERRNIALLNKKSFLAYETIEPSLERMCFLVENKKRVQKYPFLNTDNYVSKWKTRPLRLVNLMNVSYLNFDNEMLCSLMKIESKRLNTFLSNFLLNFRQTEVYNTKLKQEEINRDFMIVSLFHQKNDIVSCVKFLKYNKISVFYVVFLSKYLQTDINKNLLHSFHSLKIEDFNPYINFERALELYNKLRQ